MKHQEKKYLVDSCTTIEKILLQKGARKKRQVVSTHYYGQHDGNDVEKFVEYVDRYEIHILKESGGRYTLTKHTPIIDKAAGLRWLKKQGYTQMNIVRMAYTDYEYKNGIVGLYSIDDSLHSVILDFPKEQFVEMEKEFGLQTAEVIRVPYDKFLKKLGRLRSIDL